MIVTVVSWIVMTSVFAVAGLVISYGVSYLFSYDIKKISSVIMLGMVFCTVYAEIFSLAYKVGEIAFLVLIITIGLMGIWLFPKISKMKVWQDNVHAWLQERKILPVVVFLSVVFLASYLASRMPEGYDTYNYHIPSIRWIEEYGIVKGLGNLHTRFAYNSSFLCLQALFSFTWIYGTSMHSMNGYIWLFMVVYSLFALSIFRKRDYGLTDILRILFLLILFSQGVFISSPNTDFMPLCLTAYILIAWCDLNEEDIKNPIPYGLLGLLGVFSVSVKLSAIMSILFVIKPCANLIRDKKYSYIFRFWLLGMIVLIPYIFRNIISSGYIVYPVTGFDVFGFDWKIPKTVAVSENTAIKLFARFCGSGYEISDIKLGFTKWFPIWMSRTSRLYSVLSVIDIVLACIMIVYVVYKRIKKKKTEYDLTVYAVLSLGYLFLLFTAPAVRFGMVYFYFLPGVYIYILSGTRLNAVYRKLSNKGYVYIYIMSIVVMAVYLERTVIHYDREKFIRPKLALHPVDYVHDGADGEFIEMNGYRFYYYEPKDSGNTHLNGWDGFPGTESLETLKRIELRGNTLKDGFRVNSQNKDVLYDFKGHLIDKENLVIMGLDTGD